MVDTLKNILKEIPTSKISYVGYSTKTGVEQLGYFFKELAISTLGQSNLVTIYTQNEEGEPVALARKLGNHFWELYQK